MGFLPQQVDEPPQHDEAGRMTIGIWSFRLDEDSLPHNPTLAFFRGLDDKCGNSVSSLVYQLVYQRVCRRIQ